MVNTMNNKIAGHRFLAFGLAVSLTVTGITGCTSKQADTAGSEEAAQSTAKEQVLKGHNENEASNLGAWGRAMGAVLISINDGSPYYFGGYDTTDANAKAAKSILRSSWNISNRKQLLKQIDALYNTGSRTDYKREAHDLNKMSKAQRKKALKQVSGDLKTHYDNLQYIWDTWGNKGLLAWDLCRISHLAQWGYIADYINLDEAQAVLEPAALRLQKKFDNWDDVVINWLDSYAYASSVPIRSVEETDYPIRKNVYEKLVADQKESDPLFDDNLFHTEIIPLGTITYDSLMDEIKPKKTARTKAVIKKKKQQGKDSEEVTQ